MLGGHRARRSLPREGRAITKQCPRAMGTVGVWGLGRQGSLAWGARSPGAAMNEGPHTCLPGSMPRRHGQEGAPGLVYLGTLGTSGKERDDLGGHSDVKGSVRWRQMGRNTKTTSSAVPTRGYTWSHGIQEVSRPGPTNAPSGEAWFSMQTHRHMHPHAHTRTHVHTYTYMCAHMYIHMCDCAYTYMHTTHLCTHAPAICHGPTHTHAYICMHTCMHTSTFIHTSTHIKMHTCSHMKYAYTCTHMDMHVRLHISMCTLVYPHMCTHVHTYIHMCLHMQVHTCTEIHGHMPYKCTHLHLHVHTCICTYTHAHMYT